MPNSACFETVYEPGKVEAVSYTAGKEVSRDVLYTTGKATQINLVPEKTTIKADGHDVIYVGIELLDKDGRLVPDAEIKLHAELTGVGTLAGFGSANPITDDNYTDGNTTSFRGRAMAIIRAGYESGDISLTVSAEGFETAAISCKRQSKS